MIVFDQAPAKRGACSAECGVLARNSGLPAQEVVAYCTERLDENILKINCVSGGK